MKAVIKCWVHRRSTHYILLRNTRFRGDNDTLKGYKWHQ